MYQIMLALWHNDCARKKNQSKHRQVISSKFPKIFRGAGDLVVLGDFWKWPSDQFPYNSTETCLKSPDSKPYLYDKTV